MASPMWAGRLELVPPAAPGFSPYGIQGRGDQRMRKAITGEQVAQPKSRDPFARPSGAPRCTGPRPG
jgi:hypothetical protein